MRIVKEAEERKSEILDAAQVLFERNGFDGTSTNEILERVGIARGTLYYHFKSKEDIMDALIERFASRMLSAAREIASDKSLTVNERFVRTVLSLSVSEGNGREMVEHMHNPQNALMHQKTQKRLISGITPILTEIICEGIEQGQFHTEYPYECMEMVIVYAGTVFDDDDTVPMTDEDRVTHIKAFAYNIERLLGAESGSLSQDIWRMLSGGAKQER